MKRIDVVKKGGKWLAETGARKKVVVSGRTKKPVVKKTARAARADSQPVTVKIHKQNGRIQEERTYPRRADPRRSKG